MEEAYFEEIRDQFCLINNQVKPGKMMSSEAILYNEKVFAFFSRQKKMVFKLGTEFDPDEYGIEIQVFNPFKKRGPLNGWFEVPFSEKEQWPLLAEKALNQLSSQF